MQSATITFPVFGENFAINIRSYILIFGFSVTLYGIIIMTGFALAALYLYKRREALGLTQDNVFDIVIIAVPFGLLGARVYYVVFNASYYFTSDNWPSIFRLREGGLAVYGGIICATAAAYVYSRVKKIPFGKIADAGGFGLFIGQAVGRWGNFFNREAYGGETTLPWRMGLTLDGVTKYVHPTFLYESLWNVAGLILLHTFSKKRGRKYHGQYFLLYVAWYGLGRFFIEGLRADSLLLAGTDIRVSQILAAISCITAMAILIRYHVSTKAIDQ